MKFPFSRPASHIPYPPPSLMKTTLNHRENFLKAVECREERE